MTQSSMPMAKKSDRMGERKHPTAIEVGNFQVLYGYRYFWQRRNKIVKRMGQILFE
jgi:hypothetical protein